MITHTPRATDREATFPICVHTPRLRLPDCHRTALVSGACDETAPQAQPPQRTGYSPHSTERKLRQDTYTLSATRTPQTSSNSITIITYSCTPTMPLCVPIRGRGGASYHPSTCAKLADSPTPNCERTEHKRPNRRPNSIHRMVHRTSFSTLRFRRAPLRVQSAATTPDPPTSKRARRPHHLQCFFSCTGP